jgi:hypothetical protein
MPAASTSVSFGIHAMRWLAPVVALLVLTVTLRGQTPVTRLPVDVFTPVRADVDLGQPLTIFATPYKPDPDAPPTASLDPQR